MKCIRRISGVLAAAAILAFTTTAQATNMPVSENFEGYEPGQLVYSSANDHANKGTGFEYQWLVDTPAARPLLNVVEKSMNFSGSGFSIVGGSKAMKYAGPYPGTYDVARRRFNVQDSGDVWFSFLIQTDTDTAEPAASDVDFLQVLFQQYAYPPLSDTNSLSALVHNGSGGDHTYRVRAGNYAATDDSGILNYPGSTYFIVGRMHESSPGNYNTVDLYVNPTTLAQPAGVDASATRSGMSIPDISMIRPRFGPLDAPNDGVFLDEFRLGRSYQDVLAVYENKIRAQGPVAYWRFGDFDNSPTHTNYDTMGGLAAVAVNDAYLTSHGPRPSDGFSQFESNNSACYLFGSGDYFEVTDPGDGSVLDVPVGYELTIEAWIKSDGLIPHDAYDRIVRKGGNGDGSQVNYDMRLLGTGSSTSPGDAKLSFLYQDEDGYTHVWNSTTLVPNDEQWHQIAIDYTFGDGNSIVGYIDGVSTLGTWVANDGNGAPLPDNGALWIGSGAAGSAQHSWQGKIDELVIYARIPEPSTLVLASLGGLALVLASPRSRKGRPQTA